MIAIPTLPLEAERPSLDQEAEMPRAQAAPTRSAAEPRPRGLNPAAVDYLMGQLPTRPRGNR